MDHYLLNLILNSFPNCTSSLKPVDSKKTIFETVGIATQDTDLANEFAYLHNIADKMTQKMIYFNPSSQWCYLLIPKFKIKWQGGKTLQVNIGNRIYNVLKGSWKVNVFYPKMENNEHTIKIIPVSSSETTNDTTNATVLIPYNTYHYTDTYIDPEMKIDSKNFKCIYPYVHYGLSFNRQGIYLNRKFRDKIELCDISTLKNFTIIEPKIVVIDENSLKVS